MNIMRKLLVGPPRPMPVASPHPHPHPHPSAQQSAQQSAQHTALGLMHLRKLFSEYSHPQVPFTQKEQEDHLYNMLPLFCRVFGSCPAKDITEKFGDVLAFCQQVAKLMVSEIRRRASNQSTEAASLGIVKFLEIESTEESSNGWMLLSTINLLASGDESLIEVLTAASLPSTLVKCLYLFFDLPKLDEVKNQPEQSEFTAEERRILLQKIFVQVLIRLTSHTAAAEELARKDDLTLLFSATTSWCPPHNVAWRKSAAEVLMTLSRHGLSPPVITYIHHKGCVALCIDNMQRVQELSPLEIVEMFVTIFCFLKDSAEVAQTLLDDFRACQGYVFVSEFLLRLEQDKNDEAKEALRNLVFLVASLTTCGFVELKPSQASTTGSLFQIPGFQLPYPSGRGMSVRNVQAFQVLQSVFLKSNTSYLNSVVLDVISGIYNSEDANYFILEPQYALSQLAEKIHLKSPDVQMKFFGLLEFIVFHLKFIPCKEFISLSLLLKAESSLEFSIACMQTLLKFVKHNAIFKDVYREVGLLEVIVTCLHRYAALLKESQNDNAESENKSGQPYVLGSLVMDALALILSGNLSNADLFRECGGARCAHNMVPYLDCRQQALNIVQQLVLCNGGDDDMGTLLAMMHTAPVAALELKTHILKALLTVLRESHRTRTVFRKVGGFVYVMSVLVSMEGCLSAPPRPPWNTIEEKQILSLLRIVLTTLTIAMRFEPANAKYFAQEICYTSLSDSIRLLGCFSQTSDLRSVDKFVPVKDEAFHNVFIGNKSKEEKANIPRQLFMVTTMIRILYDMALDAFDRPDSTLNFVPISPSLKHIRSVNVDRSPGPKRRGNIQALNFSPPAPDPIIMYPDVVVGILHLLPSIVHDDGNQMALTLQLYVAEVLRSLMRSERNQQVMCEVGMPSQLLVLCRPALEEESHFLHPPLQYIFERLSAQALEPKDLRNFFRLSNPLCCKQESTADDKNGKKEGGPVLLTRVKTLVSMTTPRDFRMNGTALVPPFVEFDMNMEGFGCLYLPSIAPQNASGPSVVGSGMVRGGMDVSIVGGIGSGDRIFPPQTGLSFSSWICIEKFSNPGQDPHCVRLLTLVRHMQTREDHLICLSLLLSSRDKALIISTQETIYPQNGPADWEPETLGDGCARIWCPELLQESQWHHVVIVLSRAVLKNSAISVYVNGQLVCNQKLHYLSQNPGGGAANLTVAASVYGYIGTPPLWRKSSRLAWKQGPCLLVEEILSAHTVDSLHRLGPTYTGCLQASHLTGIDVTGPLLLEERVIFGLNALAMTQLTLAKIRKLYSKIDSKSIAKQLGMSSTENSTAIRILHNSAGHFTGAGRSLGGVVIGYQGVRTFFPKPVAKVIENVGGCQILLGLIAMAKDIEGLYASVKALVCVVRSNTTAQMEMDRIRGYQTLAMLLKKKRLLLNSHILHLMFSLVGTVDSGRETTTIPNTTAFQDLLGDLDVWREAPVEVQRSLYEHLYELVTESSDQKNNLFIMQELGLVSKLLYVMKEFALPDVTIDTVDKLLSSLLRNTPVTQDILRFGQFIAATLPSHAFNEKDVNLSTVDKEKSQELTDKTFEVTLRHNILLRNRCLALFLGFISDTNKLFCEEVMRILGFDWLLLFLQGHLHTATTILALRNLIQVLSNPFLLQRFRDGSSNGGWLRDTEPVVENRMGVVLGFNVGMTSGRSSCPREIREEAYHIPGFQMLHWLMPQHIFLTEAYFCILSIITGQVPANRPVDGLKLNLDSIWTYMFGVTVSESIKTISNKLDICSDAVVTVLAMIRALLNHPNSISKKTDLSHRDEYAITLVQFLYFLYKEAAEFQTICMLGEVLSALTSLLFPYDDSDSGSGEDVSEIEITEENLNGLIDHPAKKIVVDFLRVIVVDSLSLQVTGKMTTVVDLILESTPERTSRRQKIIFQNKLMTSIMDHLIAADILLGEQSALILTSGGSHSYIPANVFYLIARIVDKMWQGVVIQDPNKVFDFIIKLITQAKRRANISLDAVHLSLNRTILYQLSRPINSVATQMCVLEALQKLTSNRALIFGSGNYELEFIACLCYCLLHLSDTTSSSIYDYNPERRSVWHVSPHNPSENLQEGRELISTAAKKVWDELYICKKPVIEEAFKVVLPTQNKTPDPSVIRDMVLESASKMWAVYVEGERKGNSKMARELQSHLQSKILKVTGGLSRLASRKNRKEEVVRVRWINVSSHDVLNWTFAHIATVKDLVELQSKRAQQNHHHIQKYLYGEWLQSEYELTRERGLWGPMSACQLTKWMLDMTEGPCRMRRKMMTNNLFYFHYPFRPEVLPGDIKSLKFKTATSRDSKEYYLNHRSYSMVEREHVAIENSAFVPGDSSTETSDESGQPATFCPLIRRNLTSDADDDLDVSDLDLDPDQEQGQKPDNQTVLRLLEAGEKISHMFRCARIQGLDTSEGLLLFGKEHFYVVDGFTLLKTREIRDIDYLPLHMHDPIVPMASNYSNKQETKKICSKFAYEYIREVHKRRYLLQPIALEVFSADGRNYLLAFPRGMRNKIYQRFMAVATAISDNAQESVAGQKRGASVEQSASILSSLIGETSVTQRWVRGEISNFQYLMHLNTLAGRSYNDLMQYPVFPWILADYDSDELDLTASTTFRDFSKPMGAQSSERLKQFEKRYKEWDDPHGETPPYHYGTHYSSAMIVASYLVRMEPFTQHFLKLQGGHFDLADRMFHSIKEAWLSASKHNMADVKELIPEFFYLPEFLVNSNNFDLGCKQNGVCLNDVILPPWSKNDPREFIHVHRLALECDYVSAHLHEWIDLIFGCKQSGPAALEAVNVFHHLFYEGNVDIYSIDDPLKKNATIGFINNFGQIPKQLFKKAHPAKKLHQRSFMDSSSLPGLNFGQDRLFFHHLDNLKPTLHPVKELKGKVGQIVCNDKLLQAVEENKALIPPNGTRYISWSFADQTLRVGNYESDKALFVCEVMQCGEIVCCICPSPRHVITAGTSSVVSVWELGKKQLYLKHNLYGHTEAVVSLAASLAYNVIVSGSKDGSCIVWDMSRFMFVRQLSGHPSPVTAVAINDLTGDIATCAGTLLNLWTVNGQPVASVDTNSGQSDRKQQILCVAFSQLNEWDPLNVLITGSSDGIVRMWSTVFVQIALKVDVDVDVDVEDAENTPDESSEISTADKIQNYVRKMSLRTPNDDDRFVPSIADFAKSESESSLSDEDVKNDNLVVKAENNSKSDSSENVKSDASWTIISKDDLQSGDENEGANNDNKNARNFNIQRSCTVASPSVRRRGKPAPTLRSSKSETSLSETVERKKRTSKKSESSAEEQQMGNRLQSGFEWKCQLVFRGKLTMHTAFERKDNSEPAAVTAISVSKDHKALYVGDARGRIYGWSVTQQPGRVMADHWVKDEGADSCIACNTKFTFSERRHHCRNCGQLFCSRCSRFESEISRLRILKPVRVCQACYALLNNAGDS